MDQLASPFNCGVAATLCPLPISQYACVFWQDDVILGV